MKNIFSQIGTVSWERQFLHVVVCLAGFLAFLVSGPIAQAARDYNYQCRIRNPHYHPDEKELAEYVQAMEYIFVGKPIRQESTVMGFVVTTFEVRMLYKGEQPKKGTLDIVHLPDTFTDMSHTYLVRARREKDNNLYPDPLACPQYYTDEEVVSHIQYFWQRFIMGFFLLLLGVFAAYKYVKHSSKVKGNPYLEWLTK
ncbi:MAG: hypothetical protein KDI65_12700 [Alphaproteobacteria bacterium]|nr:hypothetical protein [Alphaproteobacteria bacterium]